MTTTADGIFSRSLRRCAKRRHALRTAQPFSVATVGYCDAYLYCKGILCYTLEDRVRLLDLHNSSQDEIVIDIPTLLTQTLPKLDNHCNGIFQVLYCADYIISCTYKSAGPDPTSWLIVFNARFRKLITFKELDSTDKLFVRHNKQYIYYGTHSEIGTDGYRKWVIFGFSILTRQWFDQKIHLPDIVGSEIGSTICFEFHEDSFIALSNQTSFEVEEIDWTSFYHVVRFPLASPCMELVEKSKNEVEMWRRQHQEGPIDDRWTSLSLNVDEESGELRIIEARKEWHLGASRSQRTYYTTPVKFPPLIKEDEEMNFLDFDTSATAMAISSSLGESMAEATSSSQATHNLSHLPEGPLKNLLQSSDHPLYIHPPPRLPKFTHPSNEFSSSYTLANSPLKTYHPSCFTFLDLVNDPLAEDWTQKQRLRLRVGGRREAHTLYDATTGFYREASNDLGVALKELYTDEEIKFWPPAEWGGKLDGLLNAESGSGYGTSGVEGCGDERAMVFVTGGKEGRKKIVFVGFDAGVRLEGLMAWEGVEKEEGVKIEETVLDRKGKGKEKSFGSGDALDGVESRAIGAGKAKWAWKERAFYRDIGVGYSFGKKTK